jgi:uncharacterized protein YjbI with pentapeptide repeats
MTEPGGTRTSGTTEGDLRVILGRHKAFCDRMSGGQRASLKFRDMSGLDFPGRCLAEADLSGAKFRNCNPRGADLCGANLCGADLTGSDLYDARPEGPICAAPPCAMPG